MLIGSSSNKPSLENVRRIKKALRTALDLPEDAMVTVTQLACLEEDCAPLETVVIAPPPLGVLVLSAAEPTGSATPSASPRQQLCKRAARLRGCLQGRT